MWGAFTCAVTCRNTRSNLRLKIAFHNALLQHLLVWCGECLPAQWHAGIPVQICIWRLPFTTPCYNISLFDVGSVYLRSDMQGYPFKFTSWDCLSQRPATTTPCLMWGAFTCAVTCRNTRSNLHLEIAFHNALLQQLLVWCGQRLPAQWHMGSNYHGSFYSLFLWWCLPSWKLESYPRSSNIILETRKLS